MSDAYPESIASEGFVTATRKAVVQVYENTASLVEIERELADVVAVLAKKIEKLEKKP